MCVQGFTWKPPPDVVWAIRFILDLYYYDLLCLCYIYYFLICLECISEDIYTCPFHDLYFSYPIRKKKTHEVSRCKRLTQTLHHCVPGIPVVFSACASVFSVFNFIHLSISSIKTHTVQTCSPTCVCDNKLPWCLVHISCFLSPCVVASYFFLAIPVKTFK